MAHPFYHARASAHHVGGESAGYLALHEESNAARGHWIGGLLPWYMMREPVGHVYEAMRMVLGKSEQIGLQRLPDGRERWNPPVPRVAPEQLVRTTILHLDRPDRPYPVALYVEDRDYSGAIAQVEEDWSLPPIPLAPSTDLIYYGDPIDDLYPQTDPDDALDLDASDLGVPADADYLPDIPF